MDTNKTQKPSVRQVFRQMLSAMVKKDASDLYITAGMPPSYRINSVIYPEKQPPLSATQCEQLANSTMSEKQRETFAADYEMNLSFSFPNMGRFRVNIFRQRSHVGMVIRQNS